MFSQKVFQVASSDLITMGITVVSYTLKDVGDNQVLHHPHERTLNSRFNQGYLMSLGAARTAEVKRDARIGEAIANSESTIKEAIAEEQRMAARLANDIEIAKAKRDFELKKADYDREVNAKVSFD